MTKTKYILALLSSFVTLNILAQSNYNAFEFIENKGQWNKNVTYKSDIGNGAIFLRNTGFTVLQHNAADLTRLSETVHGHAPTSKLPHHGESDFNKGKPGNGQIDTTAMVLHSNAYTMDFEGGNANPGFQTDKPQPGFSNYFIGDDSTKWASNCRIFQTITYKNVYPGIDVKYYSESGNVKYEFIVNPGADASQIAMKYAGIEKLSVKNNELIIKTSVGEVKELAPYTYQYDGSERKNIDCRYKVNGNIVRFTMKNYSRQSTLIIDPSLIFASFTGSTADNWGYTATYGPDGSFFGGGIVFDNGFPTNTGAFQTRYSGSQVNEQSFWNMGIIKFSRDGSQRMYATYIGGSDKDQPHSLFADPQGNLVIAGRTQSANFPAPNKFGTNMKGWDIVVVKLNATGSAIIGAVRVGGNGDDGFNTADSHNSGPVGLVNNYGDDARSEVILDGANNIYLASCTKSDNFYTTPGAFQRSFGGEQDAVMIKINPNCTNVTFSTYYGGSNLDAGFVLAFDPANSDIYMAGGTMSSDLPGNKAGVYQPSNKGIIDGFVVAFSNDGSTVHRMTYMGTDGIDVIFGIQFDRFSYPYIMGTTTSQWPIVNAASVNLGPRNSKQFVAKLKKDLSGFEYSTVFGNGSNKPNISPVAFLVDRCENIYVSGWGKDIIGKYLLDPVAGMPISAVGAFKKSPDESDFYFIVIERDAKQLLFGTFYGQNGGLGEHVDGGTSRFDENGVIYQAICANCGSSANNSKPRWPVTSGAWCCASGMAPATGGGCNLAALKISFNFSGVNSGVRSYINSTFDTSGCVPLDITFRDTVRNAQSYEWDFGDGSPGLATADFETMHTYNNPGAYRVMLVAIDSNSCNIRDTSYLTVRVRNDQAFLNYTLQKLQPCESLSYRFDNLSTAPANKPFKPNSFIWDFGDGTRSVAGLGSVVHSYTTAGTYIVKLILPDTNYCNSPDSLENELRLSPLVKAQFVTPPSGCIPYKAVFKNTSLAGQTFEWQFGDGSTSSSSDPVHDYAEPGTYIVKLKVIDSNTCNKSDSAQFTITVHATPVAIFTVSPTVPVENTPHSFTNQSSADAVRFKWVFGDGDSLVTTSRVTIDHQYNSTGTFNACLVAINQFGCADTTCASVATKVTPQLDVPNAFTPLGPSQASRVFVRGFAINKLRFVIYNRLGQKVFETSDRNTGWDGKFKGVVQPMDVYAYTLEVEFTDGTRASKKGDITLLR